jgi:hypothetical protein
MYDFLEQSCLIVITWISHIGVFTFGNERHSSHLKINCDSYTCQKDKFMSQKLNAYLMWKLCHTYGSLNCM